MSVPRTTHQWLKPLYDMLEGKGGRNTQFGSPTLPIGLYGFTGFLPLTTAAAGQVTGATGAGLPSGLGFFNGGTGTCFTVNDVVKALKNLGVLPL